MQMGYKAHYISAAFMKVKIERLAKGSRICLLASYQGGTTARAVFYRAFSVVFYTESGTAVRLSLLLYLMNRRLAGDLRRASWGTRVCVTELTLFPGQQSSSAFHS